jgi:hypothetical protein
MSPDDLLLQLRHPLPAERLAAARALDHAPQTSEVEHALRDASCTDPDAMVRKWSLHALGCMTCKPDGVCSADVVGAFVHALLHDRSAKVRRFAAGGMMWGQLGRDARIGDAFRNVLATSTEGILRERAATYLASGDVPRGDRPHREWIVDWQRRYDELLVA